jgi:hypothetical protein
MGVVLNIKYDVNKPVNDEKKNHGNHKAANQHTLITLISGLTQSVLERCSRRKQKTNHTFGLHNSLQLQTILALQKSVPVPLWATF